MDKRQLQRTIDPRSAMTTGCKTDPVRVVVEVDQRHWLAQPRQQRWRQVVIITRADKEDFRAVCRGFWALLQVFNEALVIALG